MKLFYLPVYTAFPFVAFLRKILGGVLCVSLLKDVTAGVFQSMPHCLL